MAKRRGLKPQPIPMKVGNDPSLWRFASLQAALEANIDLVARLIAAGEEQAQARECTAQSAETEPVPEQV